MCDTSGGLPSQIRSLAAQSSSSSSCSGPGPLPPASPSPPAPAVSAPSAGPRAAPSPVPGFDVSSWQAIFAPAGTPKEIVQRLNVEIVKILRAPDVREKLDKQLGMQLVGSTPEELAALMKREIPRWAALVKKSGATP